MTTLPQQGPDGARLAEDIQRAVTEAVQAAVEGRASADEIRNEIRRSVEEARVTIQADGGRGVTFGTQVNPAEMIPPQAVTISLAFFAMIAFVMVGLPLARAFARRMDRRGTATAPSDVSPRLERIEQAVDAIAVEIERISENQRYASRLMHEMRGLPQPGADPGWQAAARVPEAVGRPDHRG